ncbi:integrating conjugative element protein [Pseudomonas putida]|uniref:integrating conjugative element protein n=1 Tax=Pseudomonas putida TaxID=303 RepID=UPI001F5182F8|nr:integrating conjugative element protein [Pseudomonas putida]MCI1021477.1 integrating conjugative element protein [Pseudomonas putida]
MTNPRARRSLVAQALALAIVTSLALPTNADQQAVLTVVEDRGGSSALPYYQDIEPEPRHAPPVISGVRSGGAFPVSTPELSPGPVQGRVINAAGLQPMFIVGDDPTSQAWLKQKLPTLLGLQAVGLAVNVGNTARLQEIRRWAPGLQVMPVPASDIAGRLGLQHYPVLITATTLQQ